jgi:hypothetical protein
MVNRRAGIAFALALVVVLGRGAVAYANGNACWNPAFNDPTRVDVSDISNLIAKTVLYADPMDDVRRALLVVPRPAGRVALAPALAIDDASLRAHRPRAPPSA